ncbi:hypothetical protein SDC9_129009 [bioreactor metagenome]|uniref:Uncharacterized protein n=1 Tax=bioreactor metagenome TaxID=1076179 RepID=A0A645CYI7_9ZZZZ
MTLRITGGNAVGQVGGAGGGTDAGNNIAGFQIVAAETAGSREIPFYIWNIVVIP